MIIVTGTKRSGTSMWMQILKAAGFPVLGEAFPRDWGETIRDANREGFYESPLRHGIYYATNPHPENGAFLQPHETRQMVVKVFAPGLRRSDLAYLDRVVATMRNWRDYRSSLARLFDLEREGKRALAERSGKPPEVVPDYSYLPAALEWWNDNYTLLRDALIRRYPLHMVSYAAVLRDPEKVVSETLSWLGSGQREAAVAAVQESLRTQSAETRTEGEPSGLTPEQESLFDELYARIDEQRPLDGDLIDKLNAAHDELEPVIERLLRDTARQRRMARAAAVQQDVDARGSAREPGEV